MTRPVVARAEYAAAKARPANPEATIAAYPDTDAAYPDTDTAYPDTDAAYPDNNAAYSDTDAALAAYAYTGYDAVSTYAPTPSYHEVGLLATFHDAAAPDASLPAPVTTAVAAPDSGGSLVPYDDTSSDDEEGHD